ncbi:MAG: class I SAM-dependent methyltransferase [Methanobrevibacter sp.]|jgi:ubiquinone/menaquinone biosynthesis C-methylase UbiE|nr:class I SAM-dependent methyltransferase [Methanobrevibacter sp.]
MTKNEFEKPEDIDWEFFWKKILKSEKSKPKDWNKEARSFAKRSKQDEYRENFLSKLDLNKEFTAVDLGCGEGSITIPLSKHLKNLTAIDSSENMLEILDERLKEKNITNVNIINKTIEDVNVNEIGKHDIVLASRSMNGIIPIKQTIQNINEIAEKYVYMTIFGPNSWKFEKGFYRSLGKENQHYAPYYYLFNILVSMGIYPNVETLGIEKTRTYESVFDAMENGKWRLDSLSDDEKKKLRTYLKENLIENDEGRLFHPDDRADWVLFWWKK